MPATLTYRETGLFAPLVRGHVEDDPVLAPLQEHPFSWEGLDRSAGSRRFPQDARDRLCAVLAQQYQGLDVHPAVRANLDRLKGSNALTITTGHQLCLFTGPLYFPIKIMNAVRLAQDLSLATRPVIPVFWMASEDHDRAEIDHAWINGRKVHWPGEAGAPVGRMLLEGIEPVLGDVEQLLGEGAHAEAIRSMLHEAYRPGRTLAQATRHLVNALFGRFGVVVIDGDDAGLKRAFAPAMKRELLEQVTWKGVREAEAMLGERYEPQAHVREINLFHLSDRLRARIERADGSFRVLDGGTVYSTEELLDTLEDRPQVFSPNVLLRPLYQESVLPNIAYVGGGAEVAYWLQLRPVFRALGVPMPVLVLRTSVVLLEARERERLGQLGLDVRELFGPIDRLRERIARSASSIDTDLAAEHRELDAFFDRLAERARKADPTLEASVRGEAQKARRSLEHIGQKMLRAAKREQEVAIQRIERTRDHLLPGGVLAERRDNILPHLVKEGTSFLDRLLGLDPLEKKVSVLEIG